MDSFKDYLENRGVIAPEWFVRLMLDRDEFEALFLVMQVQYPFLFKKKINRED